MVDPLPSDTRYNRDWTPRFAQRVHAMHASEIRELLKVLEDPSVISFAGGIPDPTLFPKDLLGTAYGQAMTGSIDEAMQYTVSEGVRPLREWIAAHMQTKDVPCTAENILITNGSQQGLEFLGKLFLSPGDTALVTAPTYLGALQAFAPSEPRYEMLKISEANIKAVCSRDAVADAGGGCSFAYVVPDFANPSGETLSFAERRKLLRLADDLDIAIIEDSPYTELRYDGTPVAPVLSIDIQSLGDIDKSRVIYCGSFSKIFAPGLRVGWVCARRDVIERLTLIKQSSDLCGSTINQLVAHQLAETIYDSQVERVSSVYREKRNVMIKALEEYMPAAVSWTEPEGGFFIWVTLPDHLDAKMLLERAIAEAGIAYVPGQAFFADGRGANTMRLSFSMPSVDDIWMGVERLAAFLPD